MSGENEHVVTLNMEQLDRLPFKEKREVGVVLRDWGQDLIDSAARLERLHALVERRRWSERHRLTCETFPC